MKFSTTVHHQLGSTNDELMALARSGAAEGSCIRADIQTAGRGRQARQWQSPVGNLYTSILLRPAVPLARIGELSFVAGLAVGETVGQFGAEWALKWPNDVLVRGKKIAGLLLEAEPGWVVIGMGLNLAHSPDLPDKPTTSLIAEGPLVEPQQALLVLQDKLAALYNLWLTQGFAPIRQLWLDHATGIGKPVIARLAAGQEEEGRFETLDADGALLLKTRDGQIRRVLAGDVYFK